MASTLDQLVLGTDILGGSGFMIFSGLKKNNIVEFRRNGVLRESYASNLSNVELTSRLGASAGSPENYFSGKIYCLISAKGIIPESQLQILEKFASFLSGQNLI